MKIYNTMTRKKEEFVPIETGKIKMYVCGPTVYNYFHIGNARTFLFFDVVRRYFEYRNFEVTFVKNITDIDDKLIEQSITEKVPVSEIAKKYIDAYYEDINALEIRKPTYQSRATEYLDEMIALIKELEEKGFAYEKNGDVYFSVEKSKDYGKLSGRKLEDLKAGARVEENPNKKNPADFTLWKKAKPGEPKWKSPWGDGRPGWHTECVVMSRKFLGETFDIHGGAIDLIFPHHENEIAQAEAVSNKPMVNYWMHGGFLNISGQKMSKSLDNFFLTRDVLKKYNAEAIRFFFLSKHYRSPIDFNEDILKESVQAVKNFYNCLKSVDYLSFKDEKLNDPDNERKVNRDLFIKFMDNDFNTAQAIALLFEIASVVRNNDELLYRKKIYSHLLVELGQVLGFFSNLEEKLKTNLDDISEELIQLMIRYRSQFKKDKNWKMADAIRDDLKRMGIDLKDTSKGTDWEIIE